MRLVIFLRRYHVAMLVASAGMVGFYVGRFSAVHRWMEGLALFIWCVNCGIWLRALGRAHKREMDELALLMYRAEESIKKEGYR